MSRVAAIGDPARLGGYALAGADVHAASDAVEVRSAWERLPADVGLLILTPEARAALGSLLAARSRLLWAVTRD